MQLQSSLHLFITSIQINSIPISKTVLHYTQVHAGETNWEPTQLHYEVKTSQVNLTSSQTWCSISKCKHAKDDTSDLALVD